VTCADDGMRVRRMIRMRLMEWQKDYARGKEMHNEMSDL